ncbi:MAG: carbohydrate ABC transporter permease [Firmicutes bacterium]|nr:carbohydrate ABC transporter permease [Bacillota bacterium]
MDAVCVEKDKERLQKIVKTALKVIVLTVLVVWAAIAVFPFAWTLFSSFKNRYVVVDKPFAFDFAKDAFENYKKIFEGSLNIGTAYLNSLYISGLVTVGTVLIAYLFAFMLARFRFRGKGILEALVVACMMFPAFSLIFPIVKILSALNLFGEQLGVVLPQIALNLGFTTLLITSFVRTLPQDIEEAAFIDGASLPRVIFGIVLPMVKSAIVTAMIFVFLWSYNDLFLQMLIIDNEKKYPVSLLLNRLASKESGFDYGKMAAAVTLVSFPIIIVYIALQRYIIKGLTAGALKG